MSLPRYRGYIGSNMANGRSVPQNVQQLVIREYCKKNGFEFLLSATEYIIEGSSIMLDTVLDSDVDGIVFYSIHLLPKDKRKLYASGKDIHFAAENIKGINKELFDLMDVYERNDISTVIAYLNEARLFGAYEPPEA